MSKIVSQPVIRPWPKGVPFRSERYEVVIPYDAGVGHVFLNAIGASEEEALAGLRAIELDDEVANRIETIQATLDFSDAAALRSDLFPVCVPVHRGTGEIFAAGIGSSTTEAEVNLDFWSKDQDDYTLVSASLVMPKILPESKLRTTFGF